MSWKNKLENTRFSIKTGDGKIYKPLWKNGEKTRDFNYSKYDFINQEGSYIDRKKAQSNSYPLVFWFTGEDNIEQAERFEKSSLDSGRWTITHPFYGELKGQPTNLSRNDNNYGATEITVNFWESIDDQYPEQDDSISDTVIEQVSQINSLAATNYSSNAKPSTSDIIDIKSNIEVVSSNFQPNAELFNDYKQKVSTALGSVDRLVTNPQLAINSAQLVLSSPAFFERQIDDKISSIKTSYNELKNLLSNRQSKFYFESQTATLLGSISQSAVNPVEGDYVVKSDIEFVNSEILEIYDDYLRTLDEIQIPNENIKEAYQPNIELQQRLVNLITYTSKSLFVLSFDARQERTHIVERDTNLIVLTHRFLGLDAEDKNIETFKKINRIELNEIFLIKKGRVINYYV